LFHTDEKGYGRRPSGEQPKAPTSIDPHALGEHMSFITTQALALAASGDGTLASGNGGMGQAAGTVTAPAATRRGATTVAAS
jgi:hypothetical protein